MTATKLLVYTLSIGTLRINDVWKRRIQRQAADQGCHVVFVHDDHTEAFQEIRDAEILFGYITPDMLRNAQKLRWIQAPMASLGQSSGEYFIFPELVTRNVRVTNMSGIYSDVIATHVFAYLTCFARDFPKLIRNQEQRIWDRSVSTFNLEGKTLGIVGLGGIGKEVARLGKAFGMNVLAVDLNPRDVPAYIARIWQPDDLKALLRDSDVVVLCLPDAPGTVNLFAEAEFDAMKRGAYLINIGRGRTVDLRALTRALEEGKLGGAGLDVFPPGHEPLPVDHPLWRMERVIITPHCAGIGTPPERKVEVFLENLTRYTGGRDLLNVVDKERMVIAGPGYSLD
jgi:phosphoglycerate dehydrogenase-like enzyme